jgi:hypothetical protein
VGVALAALQSGPGRVQVFPTYVGVALRVNGELPSVDTVFPTQVGVALDMILGLSKTIVFPTHSGGEPLHPGSGG